MQLSRTERLGQAVKYNLFPTADMVVNLSREFGVPITRKDLHGNNLLVTVANKLHVIT
jgi:hypothetical protein